MTASNLGKRIEKLEKIILPRSPRKWAEIIQKVGENREDAIERAGFTHEGLKKFNVLFIRLVSVPCRKGKIKYGNQ